jgi:hypothetical protein
VTPRRDQPAQRRGVGCVRLDLDLALGFNGVPTAAFLVAAATVLLALWVLPAVRARVAR